MLNGMSRLVAIDTSRWIGGASERKHVEQLLSPAPDKRRSEVAGFLWLPFTLSAAQGEVGSANPGGLAATTGVARRQDHSIQLSL